MKLKQAIEIFTYMTEHRNVSSLEDCTTALKLGIEALKREESNRENPKYVIIGLLPGETEE